MYDQECAYSKEDENGDCEPLCPECGAGGDDISLESGDHGYACRKCQSTFVVP